MRFFSCVQETLRDHPRLIWLDSSIRLTITGNLSHVKHQILQTGGVLQMVTVSHSIYSATHKQLYEYLPCHWERTKHTGRNCFKASLFLLTARGGNVFTVVRLSTGISPFEGGPLRIETPLQNETLLTELTFSGGHCSGWCAFYWIVFFSAKLFILAFLLPYKWPQTRFGN